MDSEKKNKEKHNFVLNEVVKRKILDMYNISKEDITTEAQAQTSESENHKGQ